MVKEKKETDIVQLELIRKLVLRKLNSIKHKKFTNNSINDLSLAFHVFLLKYLKLDYEFTEEELSRELEKKSINQKLRLLIIETFSLLDEVKYRGRKISKLEFEKILNQGIEIINIATGKREEKLEHNPIVEKPNSWRLILSQFSKKKSDEKKK